ncbi:uncharacterized protein LOC120782253 [Bactrocera tryoni]|uniref:uncharacterized protein LOC120782253 n=1 Tax=Bactrocera tryoni TaxID=59916 RepID=UPI001A96BD65|nr:uncharacterized protein LOC120782253 [Bactrocera tryoni]
MESGFHSTQQKLEDQHFESGEGEYLSSNAIDQHTAQNSSQRLIPLTPQVVNAMMDFNGSQSSTSVSEKNFYNTFSITCLVREEVQNILQELCVTDQFIRKEEIDALIERCLREKVQIESKSQTVSAESLPEENQEIEVTVEMLNETDKNKLIVENFQILEQRITNLEERISTVLQTVPKLRHLQAKKFKINTEVIREELRNVMQRMVIDDATKPVTNNEAKTTSESDVNEKSTLETISNDKTTETVNKVNPYDDMYYAERQNVMNILNYKKSKATMELNRRPYLSPHIKPIVRELENIKFKPKQKAAFITE